MLYRVLRKKLENTKKRKAKKRKKGNKKSQNTIFTGSKVNNNKWITKNASSHLKIRNKEQKHLISLLVKEENKNKMTYLEINDREGSTCIIQMWPNRPSE